MTVNRVGRHMSSTTHEQDLTPLLDRWQIHGDHAAREALVEHFLPLARNLARRYARSSEPLDDLIQVASLGLVKALDRFDAELGHRFEAFAVPTILGELRRYFRDAAWSLHVPRGTQERALEVERAQEHLTAHSGRAPTVQEISQYMEVDLEEVLSAMQAAQAYTTLSLDAPRRFDDDASEAYGDSVGAEDERFDLIDADIVISEAIRRLPVRERRILHLRFVEGLTQSDIATRIGLSQMQISRLLRGSLEQLRAHAECEPGTQAVAAPEVRTGLERRSPAGRKQA
jgi:RNA polymerase sigma-B factor